jgi:hypothetical protein
MTNYKITQVEVCLGCGGGAMGIEIDGLLHCLYKHIVLKPQPNGDVKLNVTGETVDCDKKEWRIRGEKR